MEAYKAGTLHLSAWCGLITLIPKKGRDINYIKNWRPLTMLNMDYKILSKALALRLKEILSDIISEDQTGFMEGRSIASNLRKTIEVIEYTKKNHIPAMIMTIDFEKCFDRIEHSAIRGALNYFNIGPNFTNWVMLLFNQFELCTQNNGYNSEWFHLSCSVHQGCSIPHFCTQFVEKSWHTKLKIIQILKVLDYMML